MAYDKAAAERVRQVLAGRADLVERRMMGGLCFMVGGNMCCGVTGAALMVRVGSTGYAAALAEPHVRPMEIGDRRPGGFVLVAPEGWPTEAALAAWVRRGLDFVATLPPKPDL
jgi:hypothetical protein